MISNLKKLYALLDTNTRRQLPISVALSFAISVLEAAGIGIVMPFMIVLANPDAINDSAVIKSMTKLVGAQSHGSFLMLLGLGMALAFLLKNVLVIFGSWWQARFLARGGMELSVKVLARYCEVPYMDVAERNSAELIRNMTNVVSTVVNSYMLALLSLVMESFIIVAVGGVIFFADPRVALGVLGFFVLAAWVLYKPLRNRLTSLGERSMEEDFHILRTLKEGLGATKEIRVLNRERFFIDTFKHHRRMVANLRAEQNFLTVLGRPYLEIAMVLGVVAVAVTVMAGDNTAQIVGVLGLLGAAGLRIMPSVNRVLVLLQQMRAAMPAVDILVDEFKMTATQASSQNEDAPLLAPIGDLARPGLRVKDATFAYPSRSESALRNMDIEIPWGTSVGLVGKSGSGKSTLVDVMLGLLVPQSGGIYVDGCNIHNDVSAWRTRIGYVPQAIALSDGTVRSNIALGLPKNMVDEDNIKLAVRMAHLDEVVGNLPNGLDTVIGESGMRLSGGQRQRIGIARALYHNPDVLILDEATSALDNETEHRVSQMIKELSGTKTIIIIAHRMSTVRHCEKIAFLQEGHIIAEDSFDQLIKKCPDFARLVEKGSLEV